MYHTFFLKRLSRKRPFHQKVLHFQYDIPIRHLREAFDICLQSVGQPLYMAEDRTGTDAVYFVQIKAELDDTPWTPEESRRSMGIFGATDSYYIRLEIDSKYNETNIDDVCGNLFLFSDEQVLLQVAENLKTFCGQVILESTADYYMLLED